MKKLLEETFDIPFHVIHNPNEYIIYPENDMEELFEVHIAFRSGVRIIIEAYPQKHAAAMLNDMAIAHKDKIKIFFAYLQFFQEKQAKTSIEVNGVNITENEWPASWKSMFIRISKIEERDISFDEIAKEWALEACGMMLSLLNVEQIENCEGKAEGKKIEVLQTRYERNAINRELCIAKNGCLCKICGFDFEKTYGSIGKGFIHVHHIVPLSTIGEEYIPNPGEDLIPVCPNCHAMLHATEPPLLPDELIAILKERNADIE